ncbi:hypothetical protein IU433_04355 [Nocardia puris]|uniref:hypothetical protein n=1 Tax=Nocardia puris TaxID=208602 RepID=UPI00189616EA|nr:hypothetical protein [Nocardia puris]MBF6209815.1 hypothetical protein [Nocardia puris]MBF6366387.1 hypothetical protein [Nocardia puris]MBF6458274.1 hypothetical protein [Nocardia puris]
MTVPNPVGAAVDDATAGALRLRMEPAAFLALDRACADVIDRLTEARTAAESLAAHSPWGLGEDNPRLWTASALVRIFREKAAGGPNNAATTLDAYRTTAEQLRTLLTTARDHLLRTDAEFARAFRELDQTSA